MIQFRRCASAALLVAPLLLAAAPPSRSVSDPKFDVMAADVKAAMLTDPARAVGGAEQALAFARRAQSRRMEAIALWLLGEAKSRVAEPEEAARVLADARRIVEKTAPGTQLNADILLSEGGVLSATGQIGPALTNLRRAHAMFQASGDTRSQAKALIMIALVHANANDHNAALRYFGEAIEAHRADPGLSVAIFNGRARALKELERLPAAEAEIGKALGAVRSMNSPLLYAQVLSNAADICLERKDLVGAQRYITEGLGFPAKSDAAAYRPIFIALAAELALDRGDVARARQLIEERFRAVDLEATLPPDRPAHATAYQIYERVGRPDLALKHLAALKRLDDQATEIARSNSAAIAAARFDFANQELRIAQLKAADLQKDVAFEQARARTQRQIFVGVAAVTLLIIGLLAFGLFTIRRSRNALAVSNKALAKALAAKTEFLATTSHEIRTPLNGILGMTQVMLADPKLEPGTRDRLSVVHGAGTTMRALVDDILDVAKIETGKMLIENAPADVRRTIVESARMWEDQARAKGLNFSLDLMDCPGNSMIDATRLRQIVFNLLSNAVKFTPSGHVTVTSSTTNGRWSLVVADSGIGIAADKQEIIFEAFRQADAGTTRQFGGTGLGLSICRNLSRAMGGDVTVASELDGGATFTLDLPYEPIEEPARAGGQGRGVLVIDRSPITRAMFKALLSPVGGAVAFAATAPDALEALATAPAATLLIDDTTMRGWDDHLSAIASLAAASPQATIALLGPALEPVERASLARAGITRFVAKPIGKEALVKALFTTDSDAAALVPEAA